MKIANGAAFWGDDPNAPYQVVSKVPDLDYLTMDYLSELSMAILAIQQEKDPEKGYAADFIEVVKSLIPLWEKGARFKIVTNAGGLNPEGLKKELLKIVPLKSISALSGDDVLTHIKETASPDYNHLENGKSVDLVKEKLVSASAYLGSEKIIQALKDGADIVVTGRIADPSMVVGPAVANFGWSLSDYNKIAQATVAGHLIECGTQVTGGISTDWDTQENNGNIGFPIVEMEESGNFVVTKPPHTGGRVNLANVKEQLLYEIGDPGKYLSPDVTVSFLELSLIDLGNDRVEVKGAKGSPPSSKYKVSAAYRAGFRAEATLVFVGENSLRHAEKSAEIIKHKVKTDDFLSETFSEQHKTLLRVAVRDLSKEKVEYFTKVIAPLVTAGPPGTTGYTGGRPKVRPVLGYWPCLIAREAIDGKN